MNYRLMTIALGLVVGLNTAASIAEGSGWPITPANVDHPVANTFGEFVVGDTGPYQHDGIDILADPFDGDEAPFAVTTVAGHVIFSFMNPGGTDNTIHIRGTNGMLYRYTHLEYSALSLELDQYFKDGQCNDIETPSCWPPMRAGMPIARIANSFACNFDHLHFDIERNDPQRGKMSVNPLLQIEHKPDIVPPEILKIHLAKGGRGRWQVIERTGNSCDGTTVKGKVAIVVSVRDKDNAGSALAAVQNVGIHNLEWRACPPDNLDCAWRSTDKYDAMPAAWTNADTSETGTHFSTTSPWITTPEPWRGPTAGCPTNVSTETFMVLQIRSPSRTWETANGDTPTDDYVLSVKASDIKGNVDVESVNVCVDND